METTSAASKSVKTMLAWIDAHNRQDLKALDYMHQDVEIVEIPTGVVYRGMEQMRKLAAMAYSRRVDKEVTMFSPLKMRPASNISPERPCRHR